MDNVSISDSQSIKSKQSKQSSKKAAVASMSIEELQKQAVSDKKKIKVLKDALRDTKLQAEQATQQI